jgi:hypothetical protein
MKVVAALQPQTIVTMMKYNQGLSGNEFSKLCREKNGMICYIDVINDQIEGATNIKGSVQRNRKMINVLA